MGKSFDRRIIIGTSLKTEIGLGETKAVGLVPIATVWASYEPVKDEERLRAAAVEQKMEALFTVRCSSRLNSINGTFRLKFEDSEWQITGTKQIGRRRWLEISAWRIVQPAT